MSSMSDIDAPLKPRVDSGRPRAPSPLARGYGAAFASTLILALTGIFIRHLTQSYHLPPLVLAFWRNAFTALTLVAALAVLAPRLLRVRREDLGYLAVYGLVLAVFNALWTWSVALTGASVATVLVYSSAAFTVVLGWWFLAERMGLTKLASVALCLAGCVLVCDVGGAPAWRAERVGIGTGVASGLLFAIYTLLGRSAARRGLNPWTTILYTFTFGGLFILPGAAWPGIESGAVGLGLFTLADAWAGWGLLFLLAAGPTLLGFGLYNVSLGYLPSSDVNLIATMEPTFTAAIAYGVLGERMGATQIGGGALILAGVLLLQVREVVRTRGGIHSFAWSRPKIAVGGP